MPTFTEKLQSSLQLSVEETKIAENLFSPITFKKGELLLATTQKCNHLYFIQSGFARIYAIQDDKEITQWISMPNYFVTDLSAWLFNTTSKWNIEALTPIQALVISKSDYLTLEQQIANWSAKERMFIAHCFEQMEQRIFQFISLNAEQRYTHFFNEYRGLFNEIPHQYIASILGITPETLSRIRKKSISL